MLADPRIFHSESVSAILSDAMALNAVLNPVGLVLLWALGASGRTLLFLDDHPLNLKVNVRRITATPDELL